MPKFDLIGPGYQGRSTALDASRTVNMFAEVDKGGKNTSALFGRMGSAIWASTGLGACRGMHVFNGLLYVVSGNKLYSITSVGVVSAQIGSNLATSSGRVTMSDNGLYPTGGNQLVIADGVNIYILNVSTGSNWLPVTTVPGYEMVAVASNNAIYVAVGFGQGAYSADGNSWFGYPIPNPLVVTNPQSTVIWYAISWNSVGSFFCAIGYNSTGVNVSGTSPDGITWTTRNNLSAAGSVPLVSIAWNGTVFCAVGYKVAFTSPDGVTWTSRTIGGYSWSAICWSPALTLFCAVSLSDSTKATTSPDGITWTPRVLPANFGWDAVVWNVGAGLFCAVSNYSSTAATSPDGITWTPRSLPVFANWLSIATDGTGFVAISNSNVSANSINGTTWFQGTMPIGGGWTSIAYNSGTGYFVSISASSGGFSGSNSFASSYIVPNSWTQIAIPANTIAFIDTYFVCDQGGQKWGISNQYNGADWTRGTAAIAAATTIPDVLEAVINNHKELWLFSDAHIEINIDVGVGAPPFQLGTGGILDYGIAAKYSLAKGANSVFWLANIRNGDAGEFWGAAMANGWGAQKISTSGIESVIRSYSTISDAFGFCLSEGGHEFYVLTFPTANATWVYDTTTGQWAEWSSWYGSTYATGRWVANCYAYFNGGHYVGDFQNGNIYQLSTNLYTENGNPLSCFRTTPYFQDDDRLNNMVINRVQVDAEMGVRTITGPFVALNNGTAICDTSPDGITWAQRTMPASTAWVAVAYNGNVYCAIANASSIAATSPDGITWTQRTLPANTSWRAIAWNGSVFCAISTAGGIAATSPDGITWSLQAMPSSDTWFSIAWNGTVFCALTSGTSNSATSPDGTSWILHSSVLPASGVWSSIAWNGTVFCAVDSLTTAATSPDGIVWTPRTIPLGVASIAWNGTVFCGVLGNTNCITSPDGIIWTTRTIPSAAWSSISWNGTVFCAIALGTSIAATSPDGITWTQRAMTGTGTWYGITFGANWVNNPTLVLSYSDNNGSTWSADQPVSLGFFGAYNTRALWYRQGVTRGRIFRVACTDNIRKAWIAAHIDAKKGVH